MWITIITGFTAPKSASVIRCCRTVKAKVGNCNKQKFYARLIRSDFKRCVKFKVVSNAKADIDLSAVTAFGIDCYKKKLNKSVINVCKRFDSYYQFILTDVKKNFSRVEDEKNDKHWLVGCLIFESFQGNPFIITICIINTYFMTIMCE